MKLKRCLLTGKVKFGDEAEANAAIKRMTTDGCDTSHLNVYKCKLCHSIHVGNAWKKQRLTGRPNLTISEMVKKEAANGNG